MEEDPEITPMLLLGAYSSGVFPMADGAATEEVYWIDPEHRGILPLDAMHVSRRLARAFRTGDFEIEVNRAFAEVVNACADRPETWINGRIHHLYRELHRMGFAHSVEIWSGGALRGGLYGVALGGAFFGESMFSRDRDTSKFALIALVARLRAGGFTLLDMQFITPHLASLGGIEIPRAAYHRRLRAAVERPANFLALPVGAPRQLLLQLTTQTS